MHEGSFPTKTLRLHVPTAGRWESARSRCRSLAFLPDAEVAEIVKHNAPPASRPEQYRPERLLESRPASRAGAAIA
jgi:hypothetical protein